MHKKHEVVAILEDIVSNKEGVRQVQKGSVVHGQQEYVGQGNCLALVPRSEGLKALPLIATSVTRDVKVDVHAVKREA